MNNFKKTEYILESMVSGERFEDGNWELDCIKEPNKGLIFADYAVKQLRINEELPGIYRFSDWLPIERILVGSGAPITYKSEGLAKKLGISNLWITFNGYWPEKGAQVMTGSFKEYEAYSVCARVNPHKGKAIVVASAGNTARAFARVCSENNIPLLLCMPEDCLSAMWFKEELNPCVKLIVTEKGSDYFDAIHLSNVVCEHEMFYAEGGAKNVARRDGMGTAILSAVTTIGEIPDYYFQAVGSGTGAIAAWEANKRFIADGRYGTKRMKLMVSQNYPFTPMYDAWKQNSRELHITNDDVARKQVEEICAKVLSNRKPPYGIVGGMYDALMESGGDMYIANNEEANRAARMFKELEGVDIETAASVAVASLVQAVEKGDIDKDAVISLNITGGGAELFKSQNEVIYKKPDLVFSINAKTEDIHKAVIELFR